ncbi:MAG TPA: GvpL/GvpF family gas vesicle protein [Dehalococcoidia bacterium]|nr:GvpL/GvpF family gas vesicle protein [Dehalococcoidia bacterium]
MAVEEQILGYGAEPPERAPAGGKYVYCIIECAEPRAFGRMGIGGRNDEVYTIEHGGLAAVVSDTPVVVYDPTRENALTHEHVIDTVLQEFTVIPMSFGAIFRTHDDVVEFLKDTADALRDVLQKMTGKIELGLKVNWDPETVLKQVEDETEEIRRLKEEILTNRLTSTYFARMQLGRMVERAMSEAADTYVREIYDQLRGCAIASRHNKPIGDKMILNAAFLVERERAAAFDEQVQEIARKYQGQLRFQSTGPWPPYNFVNIHLKLERAGAGG